MTRVGLYISVHGAEPYVIADSDDEALVPHTIRDAIEQEARTCASEANSDHLEDPSDEAIDRFREKVERDAFAHLTHNGQPVVGATYKDPLGITWAVRVIPPPPRRLLTGVHG